MGNLYPIKLSEVWDIRRRLNRPVDAPRDGALEDTGERVVYMVKPRSRPMPPSGWRTITNLIGSVEWED